MSKWTFICTANLEVLQSGILLYGEIRGAPNSILCHTPKFDLGRTCKNTISFYTAIIEVLQSGKIKIRATSRCTKVANKKYGHSKKRALTIETQFLCTGDFEMHQSGKKKYGHSKKRDLTVETQFLCTGDSEMHQSGNNKSTGALKNEI